jgi:hypothetical protein
VGETYDTPETGAPFLGRVIRTKSAPRGSGSQHKYRKAPRWCRGFVFLDPRHPILLRITNRHVISALRPYSLTTCAPNTSARLPSIGDLLKISEGC